MAGSGRHVEHVAGTEVDDAETIDVPALGARHVEHDHFVGVGMRRQSGDAGRGEVGVRLDGVTEHLLQIEAELGERWP